MDMGRIIQMVINTVLRRVINGVLDKGMGMFSRRGRQSDTSAPPPPPQVMTEAEDADMAIKRARQIANKANRQG